MISSMRRFVIPLGVVALLALAACGAGEELEQGAVSAPALAFPDEAALGRSFAAPAAPAAAAAPAPRPAPAPKRAPSLPAPSAVAVAALAPESLEARVVGDADFSEEQVAQLVTQQRIIVRTVHIELTVTDISASLDSMTSLAREMGGWVVESSRRQKREGAISFRVPAGQLDQAILRLRDMAVDVESEVTTSRDVTDEYVDTTARLDNQQATEAALLKLLDRAETVEEALKVQQSLTQVQQEVERLQGRIKFLEETSAFSLINVTLRLEPAEMEIDAGPDQTEGVGQVVRFRAFFKPSEGIDEFFFTWDFGDGTTLSSDRTAPTEKEDTRVTATMTHVYRDERDSPFIAQIEMTGSGESGVAEGEDTLIVNVTRIPVIEVFAGESITVEEDVEVEVSGSFTRPEGLSKIEYRWDFGDGSPADAGTLEDGITTAVATHVYVNHRPFPFTATLKITGQSDAGKVESSSSVQVRVTEAEGWTLAGWSPGDQGKTAVRSLSGVGQGIGTVLIWLAIFSPVWIIGGVVGVIGVRRSRGAIRKAPRFLGRPRAASDEPAASNDE